MARHVPNLYGSGAGSHNLTGFTNTQIASVYMTLFNASGQKTDAQVMATALAVYATNQSLGGSAATAYGFQVSSVGLAGATWNVGSNGAAFGVANNSTQTVFALLSAANQAAVNGVLCGGNSSLQNQSNVVFSGINQTGDIT